MELHVITESASGSVVHAAVGQPVTIQLEEIPTTGYRWRLDPHPDVDVASAEYTAHAASAIGGGGLRRFVLSARAPGDVVVRARLWREWQGEGSTIKRFEVTLRVR